MWNLLTINKSKGDREIKTFILKRFFNSSNQKKAVTRAVRESTRDQQELLEKYKEMVRQ